MTTPPAAVHPPTPCRQCRWCAACGCDRNGLCHAHQHVDEDVRGAQLSRARYEEQRSTGEHVFAEFGRAEHLGKIHTLTCHVVRSGIADAESFLSDPVGRWRAVYPNLLTRAEAEQPGRKRCAQCAPDVREFKRPPRQRLSGLGWPHPDGSCARSPGLIGRS